MQAMSPQSQFDLKKQPTYFQQEGQNFPYSADPGAIYWAATSPHIHTTGLAKPFSANRFRAMRDHPR
jgi:hypothetical protein